MSVLIGRLTRIVITILFLLPISIVQSRAQSCEVALVLAIDASSSVNYQEYDLQMEGTASALLDPEVTNAIVSLGGIYLAGFEWNGVSNQSMILDWSYLQSEADIRQAARKFANHSRYTANSPTALGSALGYAHRMFPKLPGRCLRNVIDVSGDGESNHGIKPPEIYNLYDFSDIVVNGLAIIDPDRRGTVIFEAVDEYYAQYLLHGPASFVVVAEGFEDFARAMRVKLLRELAPSPVGFLDNANEITGSIQ